ncbi:glycine oxidase ThiO [Thermomicrobiaceae bacterium CFH 74404]|uniref:Glycine oxidase ThiO n=1 Tax=Thermalbibacter longus TaxID=2951981 RepID=A0AA41WBA7_9BACT|nr:glycine oxidase ThiO [Thermalbibacter longus]MCM8748477.1 glycine oxidase ThiO [Thermalbibacter longus]
MQESAEIAIIGGGIIGCAVAYQLAARGHWGVTVLERDRVGGQAMVAFAGLLSGAPPGRHGDPFGALAAASLERFPRVAADLRERTGIDPELRHTGALYLALTADEEAALRLPPDTLRQYHPECRWLEARELRELEPEVSPLLRGALYAPWEWQVLSPRLVQAYARAAALAGARIRETVEVRGVERDGDRVTALLTSDGRLAVGQVVLAAGAWSGHLGRLFGLSLPVGPLRGQIVRLAAWGPAVRHSLYRGELYIGAKADGTVAVGSTEELASFDRRPTGAGVALLSRFAVETVPALGQATFLDAWAGLRPLSEDGLPLIGRAPGLANVLVATGHARNGVLLSPVTAEAVADLLEGRRPAVDLAPFDPARFAR